MRIALQRLLDDQRQSVEPFAHVGVARRQPNPNGQSVSGSSARQRPDDARQRRRVDIRANDNPLAACEHDLHSACRPRGDAVTTTRLRRRASATTVTGANSSNLPLSAGPRRRLTSPREKKVRVHAVALGHLSPPRPGAKLSASITRFSLADHRRRRRRPSALPLPSATSDSIDRVHYALMDTIIAPHLAHYPDATIQTRRPSAEAYTLARRRICEGVFSWRRVIGRVS